MVKISKLNYNLNHIYSFEEFGPDVPIGSSNVGETHELVLYERSIALTSDLKRLPILRSMALSFAIRSSLPALMTASAINGFSITAEIFTDDSLSDDSKIWSGSATVYYDITATQTYIAIDKEEPVWPYKGGVLLFDKLYIVVTSATDVNVSSANIDNPSLVRAFFEIDWVPISKEEFKEYILENVYARGE